MKNPIKKVEVVPYNPQWPKLFEAEAAKIKDALRDHCKEIHHIGSTSVPGLIAKEDLDILCVVDDLSNSLKLQDIGYTFKGEINIPLRYFFSKNTDQSRVNLHVTEPGHGFIALNLCFRDYLRTHEEARKVYGDLKEQLVRDPTSFERVRGQFPKYTLRKGDLIRQILDQAGFNETSVCFCFHENEWEAAKQYRQKEFFDKVSLEDPFTWTFDHPNHVHMVLYRGTKIIGYAHIQRWPENRTAMRIIVIEESLRGQGYGSEFLHFIEKWLRKEGVKSLHIESSPEALLFYRSMGYVDMAFNDPDGYESHPRDTPVGKLIVD